MKNLIVISIVLLALRGNCYSQACTAATEEFCKTKAQRIGTVCHGAAGGALVYFDLADGSCVYCRCSCVASSTPVASSNSGWVKMGEIKVGDRILALQENSSWKETQVTFSDGTESSTVPVPYAIYLSLKNDAQLVTTPDHIFLLADKTLRRADRLTPLDKLMGADMKPLEIKELFSGQFKGNFHNVTVGEPDNDNLDLNGHFINTNGVISGDYYVQSVAKENIVNYSGLEQIGSDGYAKKYSKFLGGERMLGLTQTTQQILFGNGDLFIPYKPVAIPDNAINFLPKKYEQAIEGSLLPLDYSVPYEVAEYIVHNFRRFYPDVEYHIDWADNTVNAYAWMVGNKRHVALKGGLIRHNAIKQEAVGLVLAHELGHHYGGGPKYPNNPWASCEGQADYWGALVCERKVWWGPYALEQIRLGGDQLYNLFAYGLKAGNLLQIESQSTAAGICTHPAAACRLATYRAALRLDEKPSCAGDQPSLTRTDTTPALKK